MKDGIDWSAMPIAKNDATKLLCTDYLNRFVSLSPTHPQQIAFGCVVEGNRLPNDISQKSYLNACMHAFMLGFPPGPQLQLCYFIPFRKKGQPTREVSCIVGYRGYIELAMASGFLTAVHTDIVLESEEFSFLKTEDGPKLHHVVGIRREFRKPEVVGAYCVYSSKNGGRGVRVVPRHELNRIDKNEGLWIGDTYSAMAMKTAVRRAAKEWPTSNRLALALRIDDVHEDEIDAHDAGLPSVDTAPAAEEPLDLSAIKENEQ